MIRIILAAATIGFGFATTPGMPAIPDWRPAPDEFRFTRALRPGQTLGIGNIDGDVHITRGNGREAEVVVTRRVIRGNGELVKAIMEETSDGIKVCTVYLQTPGESRTTCGNRNGTHGRRGEPLEVAMTYVVRLPAGVRLDAATVDGDLTIEGIDTPARISTVDGNVTLRGTMPERVSSVDGDVTLDIVGRFTHDVRITTVDGSIDLTLPADVALDVSATAVDGELTSNFPMTVAGQWGPRTMRGQINGGGPMLRVNSVDGALTIRKR